MCSPVDFEALQTCIIRVAALSAAGLGTHAVRQAVQGLRHARWLNRGKHDALIAAGKSLATATGRNHVAEPSR